MLAPSATNTVLDILYDSEPERMHCAIYYDAFY